jgi:hypothetical protein
MNSLGKDVLIAVGFLVLYAAVHQKQQATEATIHKKATISFPHNFSINNLLEFEQ